MDRGPGAICPLSPLRTAKNTRGHQSRASDILLSPIEPRNRSSAVKVTVTLLPSFPAVFLHRVRSSGARIRRGGADRPQSLGGGRIRGWVGLDVNFQDRGGALTPVSLWWIHGQTEGPSSVSSGSRIDPGLGWLGPKLMPAGVQPSESQRAKSLCVKSAKLMGKICFQCNKRDPISVRTGTSFLDCFTVNTH